MPSHAELANAIRVLSIDSVQAANSGHPGMPMGMADIASVLWNEFLSHNPADPNWANRDRFVLSNGHGSMLQYALLHLSGYDLSLQDLKDFRQLHSKTPGHPEYGYTPGVETTTGPLGQGLANGVGFALAEKILAAQFNQNGLDIVDHYTYVFVGDGCLMEGISHEACSLAGVHGLGKLIVFYDDNDISIDGDVSGWYRDNTPQRFEAYNWHVVADVDGHDADSIRQAITKAREVSDKPTIICCKTTIGYGSPNLAGTAKTHGAPLGVDEIAVVRKQLNWNGGDFEVPNEIYASWDAREKGSAAQKIWSGVMNQFEKQHPKQAQEFKRRLAGELPANWEEQSKAFITKSQAEAESVASRKASLFALNAYASLLPELIGGSADLSGSNCTQWSGSKIVDDESADGNYINYGVREFAMSAIINGLALYGGFLPFGGTFLVFCDYARNAIRLTALMKQRAVFVYTHDSIGLGEDGPTHQPIEHANMLRMTPNMFVWRPCDVTETAVAWQQAIENQTGPASLLLSRQTLPHQPRDAQQVENIQRGAYVLKDCAQTPEIILLSTGSEISLAMEAAEQLTQQGKNVRVVSMPCTELFVQQDAAYQESVLPAAVTKRIAIEAGSTTFWYKYVGLQGKVIGIDRYGESAPAKEVYRELGITVENIINSVNQLI